MKIGLVCPYHIFRGGGVQEHVLALMEEYRSRGHWAKIITPLPRDYKGSIPEFIITLGISMNTKAFTGTAWQWSISVDTEAIDEVFEREKFDILHFHEPWIPVWSRQLVSRSQSANVATMHGRVDNMTAKAIIPAFTAYTRNMLRHFDAFTASAEVSAEYFRTLSKRPISIVPNGINLAKYSQGIVTKKKLSSKRKMVYYVGRLENRKGVKYLLKAFDQLAKAHKEVHLLIGGSGPDEDKLKKYVDDYSIPRVRFDNRYVPEKEKLKSLFTADIFCAPSPYGESFGIVLLEAMAAGCPIVAGDNVGYVGVMKGTGAISLVNPKDTNEFTRRMELMLYDENLRVLWKSWAKDYVKQFDWPIIANQYLEIYERAIKHYEHRKKTT